MKRIFFIFTLTCIYSNFIFATSLDTRQQIKMKVRPRIEDRSIPPACPIQVYINSSILEVCLESPLDEIAISLINSETGAIVYQEIILNSEKLIFLNLDQISRNEEYRIEISTNKWLITGLFILE